MQAVVIPFDIYLCSFQIVSTIETNQVTVIQGATGCGKTTQVPQFILDSCVESGVYCNIIITQPRRIAAISVTKRVSEERSWPVGTLVGYQVGLNNTTSSDTRLTFCTTGVLLQKLISKKNMNDYTHVILDEVHERDQDMDFALLVVRKLLRTNSHYVKVTLNLYLKLAVIFTKTTVLSFFLLLVLLLPLLPLFLLFLLPLFLLFLLLLLFIQMHISPKTTRTRAT